MTATTLVRRLLNRRRTTTGHTGATADWHPLAELADDDPGTGRHHPGNISPVPADYLLTPAARQLVTGTDEAVPAGPDDATGLYDLTAIDRREETYDLADLRALLAADDAPQVAVDRAMADAGCTTAQPTLTQEHAR